MEANISSAANCLIIVDNIWNREYKIDPCGPPEKTKQNT